MMEYQVKRRHLGDKPYEPGDTRNAKEADVAHLIEAGVLVAVENKADEPTEKKARAKKSDKAD